MRLLKLIAYALLGYVIYELYRGMSEAAPAGAAAGTRRQRAGSRDLKRALNEDPGRMNITGPGRGTTVTTDEPTGGRSNRVVGRGVISESE